MLCFAFRMTFLVFLEMGDRDSPLLRGEPIATNRSSASRAP